MNRVSQECKLGPPDEMIGPAGLTDGDYGGIPNGPPHDSLRESSQTAGSNEMVE